MTTIHELARDGKTEDLISLLKNKNLYQRLRNIFFRSTLVNEKDADGRSPLHLAAQYGHTEIVEKLIVHGADVNAKDNDERTPLHLAAQYGHTETVETLITQGANINAKDNDERTPLHLASQYGHKETVKPLIAQGADVNVKDNDERTALYYAACNGQTEIVKMLLDQGANVDAKVNKGVSSLHIAAQKGYIETVNMLISQGADVNTKNNKGRSPLYLAAQNDHTEIVKTLITQGSNINAKDNFEWTPLHSAAYNNHTEIVKTLTAQGADVNARDNEGMTPLHRAANYGHIETVETLIAQDANVNATDNYGKTPLHRAAKNGHIETVEALIAQKADVNAKDNIGVTPLYQAVLSLHIDIVIALIAQGADVNATDNEEMTPLHYAENANIVKTLISQGADINATDNDERTPLHIAAATDHSETVESLIAQGADVNAKDSSGFTPLHFAVMRDNYEISQALITQGSNVNAKNIFGKTPLFLAVQQGCGDELVKHLLSLPNIQVNEIGPDSLLSFYADYPEMTALLQAKGVLEHRTVNADGTINYNARGQSIHSARTEETVKQTFDALMQAHNPENDSGVIEKSYVDFQKFLTSDNFSQLAKDISKDPNGFGSDRALHRAVKSLNQDERYEVLMRDIAGNLNGIIQRVNHPANSQRVKDDFKKAISLVWLTLQKDEGWETLKGLMTDEEKKKVERHELMLTFIKGLFDIQHEYFRAGNSLSDAPYAACSPGTVSHTLAIFSQQHDKILVTDVEPTPVYDPKGPIKDRLMADDYQRLIDILKASFSEESVGFKGYKDLEEVLSGSSDTLPILTKEMIDTFFRPNYTNVVIEGRPTLIPEHRALLESLLGKVKEQFYTQLNEFNVPDNLRNITDAFIGLEDTLDQMSVQKLAQAITSPTAASNPNPVIFSGNYNRLIPANKEQAYQSCQTTPEYINDMLERLATNPESQRVNLFKEAITAHPEYSNETWFTALSQNQQQTINELNNLRTSLMRKNQQYKQKRLNREG